MLYKKLVLDTQRTFQVLSLCLGRRISMNSRVLPKGCLTDGQAVRGRLRHPKGKRACLDSYYIDRYCLRKNARNVTPTS